MITWLKKRLIKKIRQMKAEEERKLRFWSKLDYITNLKDSDPQEYKRMMRMVMNLGEHGQEYAEHYDQKHFAQSE